jgi:hypothetical protein
MHGISALAPDGAVSFRRKTPAGALETAIELIGLGSTEVGITFKGQFYTPIDFVCFCIEKLPDEPS